MQPGGERDRRDRLERVRRGRRGRGARRAADRRRRARARHRRAARRRAPRPDPDDRADQQRRRRDLRLPAAGRLAAGAAEDPGWASIPAVGERDIYTRHVATPTGLRLREGGGAVRARIRAGGRPPIVPHGARAGARVASAPRWSRCDRAPTSGTSSSTPASGTRSRRRSAAEQRQQRLQLDLGLGQLLVRHRVADDARRPRSSARRSRSAAHSAARHRTRRLPRRRSSRPALRTSRGRSPRARGSARARPRAARRRRRASGASARRSRARRAARRAGRGSASRGAGCSRSARAPAPRPRRPTPTRAQRPLDPVRDDRVLFAIAGVAQQLLAEVRVDGGVGAAAHRGGEREGRDALALPAHEQLGARGDQDVLAAPDAEHEAGRELVAQHAQHRRGGRAPPPAWTCTSRESTILLRRPARIMLRGLRDGLLVVLGRHRADHLVAARRRRVEQRSAASRRLATRSSSARSR